MSDWIRFEDGRQRNNAEYGTILKDGRMVISNDIAQAAGVLPGCYVEIYYRPDQRQIGLKVGPRTPYSLKVTSTGPKDHDFTKPLRTLKDRDAGKPSAIVSVRSFLHSRHIGLASKVRGQMFIDQVTGMFVFEFPADHEVICPSEHAAAQLEKAGFVERVAGDVG